MTIDIPRERSKGSSEVRKEPWSAWRCPARQCDHEVWYVQADAWTPELWHVGEEPERSDWKVAASAPICPRCATTLVPTDVVRTFGMAGELSLMPESIESVFGHGGDIHH